jgi:fluoride ion exporter CrcB/FEX
VLSAAEVPIEEIEEIEERQEAVQGPIGQLDTPAQLQWRNFSLEPAATPSTPRVSRRETAFPLYNTWKLLVSAAVLALALAGCAAAAAAAAAWHDARSLTLPLALLLSPPFAVLRYALSFHNRRHPRLPAYTLLCNAGGALLSGISAGVALYLCPPTYHGDSERAGTHAQARSASEPAAAGRALLCAVSLGAAGSLSTVSSFVNELRLLSPAHATRYALATMVVGQSVAAAVDHGFQFAVGAS